MLCQGSMATMAWGNQHCPVKMVSAVLGGAVELAAIGGFQRQLAHEREGTLLSPTQGMMLRCVPQQDWGCRLGCWLGEP
jgi:hypothetical protein